MNLKDNIVRLKDSLKKAKELGIDPKQDGVPLSSRLINYKEKQKEHYHNIIKNCYRALKDEFEKTGVGGINFKSKLNKCERNYLDGNIEGSLEINNEILNYVSGLEPTKESSIDINLRTNLPLEIKQEIESDFKELKKCFDVKCYRSVMVLCGRILEIALHRKYYETTSIDILEKNPGIGLGTLVAKLREKNVALDPGISQQIHLVNQIRVFSVHKKKQEFNPSKEQAHAMILYTIDIISKLF